MPATTASQRSFIASLAESIGREVVLRGWVHRLRVLGKTSFVVLKDCPGMRNASLYPRDPDRISPPGSAQ